MKKNLLFMRRLIVIFLATGSIGFLYAMDSDTHEHLQFSDNGSERSNPHIETASEYLARSHTSDSEGSNSPSYLDEDYLSKFPSKPCSEVSESSSVDGGLEDEAGPAQQQPVESAAAPIHDETAAAPLAAPIGEYDSDSEDEAGYTYRGLAPLMLGNHMPGSSCMLLTRGFHFLPHISKKVRSQMRKHNDAGEPIFSFSIAGSDTDSVGDKIAAGRIIQRDISTFKNENPGLYYKAYQKYINTFDPSGFKRAFSYEVRGNCIVSTSEEFDASVGYSCGIKKYKDFGGKVCSSFGPEYDNTGKPKHPYLGKIYVVLANETQLDQMGAFFAIMAHANKCIDISWLYLFAREVSIPGFIPGECVVFSTPFRVPSLVGEHKDLHIKKYGLTKRKFDNYKAEILAGNEKVLEKLLKCVNDHLTKTLSEKVQKECAAKGIRLIYKTINESSVPASPSFGHRFTTKLPTLDEVKAYRKA